MKQKYFLRLFSLIGLSSFIILSCSKDDDSDKNNNGNDSGRYRQAIFTDVQKQTVAFTADGSLEMDIYSPVGDDLDERPVIVMAHGGSFIGGTRDLPDMERMCETFAKHGYVAASISYRLGPGFQIFFDSLEVLNVVVRAVHDGKAAIRYLRKSYAEEGNPFGIDTTRIIGGGNSAGAILMIHLGYMNNPQIIPQHIADIFDAEGGIEGTRGNPGYSSRIHGVINLAGAINNLSYMEAGGIPLVSAHGDDDKTVPFNCGPVLTTLPAPEFRNRLCGSGPMHDRAKAVNIRESLLVFPNDDHCPWIGANGQPTEKMDQVENHVINFLYQRFIRN